MPHICAFWNFLYHFTNATTLQSVLLHTFEHTVGICLIHHQFIISSSPKSRVQRCLTASSLSAEALLSNPVQRRYVNTITVQRRHAKRMAPDAKSTMQTWRPTRMVFLLPALRDEDNRRGASLLQQDPESLVLRTISDCEDHLRGWRSVHKVASAQIRTQNCHTFVFLHGDLVLSYSSVQLTQWPTYIDGFLWLSRFWTTK